MRQRTLLTVGVGAVVAALILGGAGITIGGLGGRGADIGIDRAVQVAKATAAAYAGGNLRADEVIEFSQNYYASIREKDTGVGAFEILIDRATGTVTREPGPDLMWNTKYSPMPGGMMGVRFGSGASAIGTQAAQGIAQRWLDANRHGSKANPADPFYGYYTVDFTNSDQLAGMVSVNAYTGQVWFHSWHGSFIRMRDLGA